MPLAERGIISSSGLISGTTRGNQKEIIEMIKVFYTAIILVLSFILNGCITGAGTHGRIKDYTYSVNKKKLWDNVLKVIDSNKTIYLDNVRDEYNDLNNYITLHILVSRGECEYTVHLTGDTSSDISDLSVVYAWDEHSNGGSDADGGMAWYKFALRRKLIRLFENEFIDSLDKKIVR